MWGICEQLDTLTEEGLDKPLLALGPVLLSMLFGNDEFIKADRLLITTRAVPTGIALALGRETRAMMCGKVKHEKCMNLPWLTANCSTSADTSGTTDFAEASTFSSRETCTS